MSDSDRAERKEERKGRREKVRAVLASLRARAQQVCGPVKEAHGLIDRLSSLAKDINEFVEGTEARELVPGRARRRLKQAAEMLKQAKERTSALNKACDRVQKALKYADKLLAPGFPLGAAVVGAAVVLVAVGIAAAVILPNGVTVLVENQNCDTINLSGIAGFLPGIDFPGGVPTGEQGRVLIPRAFVGRLAVEGSELTLEAFGRRMPVGTQDVDLSQSSWDGDSLSALEGSPIPVTGDQEHVLRVHCR